MSITRLDAAASAAASTLAYAVSAGSDRLLVVQVHGEWDPGNPDDDVTAVDYGGQAMVKVRFEAGFDATHTIGSSVWYLLDAGIAAASGSTITPTFSNPANQSDPMIHAASYEGARQDAQVVVEHKGDNVLGASPDPITTIDLQESSGNLLVAGGSIGEPLPEGTVSSWSAAMTEQTDQLSASAASSYADRLCTTEDNQDIELNWVGPVNRQAALSVHFAQVGFVPSCLREASATADATSSATAYEVIPGMTLTPGGGDYLAWFSASVNADGGLPESIFVAIFVNGVLDADTEREIHFDSSFEATTFLLAATHSLVQPTDGQVVDIRWRVTSGSTTMTVRHRTLNLIKLDAADVTQVSATGDTNSSASYVLMDSMTITPGAGKYALFFTVSAEANSGALIEIAVFVNGVIVQHTNRRCDQESSIPNNEECFAIACEVNPGDGQAVEIRWRRSSGVATAHERTLTLWKTDQIQEVNSSSDTTISSSSFALMADLTLTPAADQYLVIATGSWESDSTSRSDLEGIIEEAGVEVPHTERRAGIDGSTEDTAYPWASNGLVNVNGSQLVETHWRRSASGTATSHERTMILISCLAVVEKDAVDDVDLAIVEAAGQTAVMIDPAPDTVDLAVAEDAAALEAQASVQDNLDLALAEDAAGASEADRIDTLDLAVLDGPGEVTAGLAAEDDLDLAIDEEPAQVAAGITAQDTLALAIAEAAAQLEVAAEAIDTLDLVLLEQAALAAAAQVADTLDLAIDDAAQVAVQIVAQDVLDLAIVEAAAQVAAGLTAQDTLDLAIAEAAEVVSSGLVEKEATDTLALAIVEAAAQVAVGVTAEDTLGLAIAEGVADLLAKADPADTTGLTVDEIKDLLAAASRLDGLDLSLGEVAEVAAAINAFDTLSITIDDAGQVTVAIDASDNLDLALAEVAQLLALLGVSDTLSIVIDEVADVLALIARSDTLDLAIDDAGQVAVQVTAADDIDLAIVEGPGQVVVGIVASDTLSLAIAEAAEVLAFLQRADTLALALVEGAPVIFVVGTAEDTLDLAIVDQAAVQVPIEATDVLDLGLAEVAQVVVAIQDSDLLALSVDEIQTLAGFLNRSDIAGLALGEDAQLAVFLEALDTIDLAIDDASALTVALQAADTLGISIAEFSQVFNALVAADTLGLAIDEGVGDVEIGVPFDGILVQPFTLVACREAAFTLEVVREVRFTLQIEGSGVQIP